jgi:RNA methyltransferase, TrmH family
MLSHNQTKFLTALQIKKYRQKYRKFIVEGEKMIAELLLQKHFEVDALYGLERWASENDVLLRPVLEKFNPTGAAELKKVSTLSTPNRVLAVVNMPEQPPVPVLPPHGHWFYLDGLQDPGNLGAILRIADWFGMRPVFCSPDCVDAYNPKVVQAGMGAFLRVPVFEIALPDLLARVPGLPVCGAVLDGENVFKTKLPERGLVVIGNEGRGIGAEAGALLTRRIGIPRPPGGGAESLNAAVAAGILAGVFSEAG